jgi:hypothetical protein
VEHVVGDALVSRGRSLTGKHGELLRETKVRRSGGIGAERSNTEKRCWDFVDSDSIPSFRVEPLRP